MFEFIRKHQRLMQLLLLLLILPSFVLVGVSSYQERGGGDGVATVAGKTITQQQWEEAQRRQIDQARQQMGAQFDQKLFETPEAKQAILDQLVAERAVNAEVERGHLTVSDAVLAKAIGDIQMFRKADGSFDKDQYIAALAAQGMTPEMFDARMRHDMAVQQLAGAVSQTAFAPRSVANRLSDINDQEREVQELMFPLATYAAQVKVTDDMVKAYYDKHAALFQVPESVKAEYVVFNADVVQKQVTVSDAEVADVYNKNKARFSTPEKRSASHILFNVAKDAKPADDAAAKAKAEAALAEVRKNPGDFAKIAKAQSQDPGSAELGGDLGVVEKGVFVKPVEDAIYGLKEGETSGLVRSEFGYHIIKVTKVVPTTQKSLEEAKPEIVAELQKTKMSAKYSELAETFSNTVYEQADSLKPVADKLGLQIQTADGLGRTPNPALGNSPVNNDKFLKAIFSNDAIKNKRNTEAVEVAPSTLVAGRVVEFRPATKRPLAEVEAQIRQRVTQEEALRLAKQAGEAKLAAARASGDATGFGEPKIVSRTKEPPFSETAALAVLKADTSKLPAYVGVDVPGQGYGVYRIVKVSQPAQPDQARRKQEAEQIGRAIGGAETYGYVEALKQKAKAKINVKPADLGANAAQ
ncbi:SurA N-terminal domain-containing protein [Massilia sp. YIM B02763]|uniref:SurA N-terminal domain-containing protein n=1 Tax=Massilia sp. YIM B02763 TaxID=3050130 RepID=UPI0025B6BFB5|nr:SurA N-terminal domain-containing protein [Massilia sp. YIM B02763]MDN4054927.1 SurA N-terminal domain-containing protein [Massilia sp. YIM B02763]